MVVRSNVAVAPAPEDEGPDGSRRQGRIGWVVAGSLASGALAALLLAVAPVGPATESAVTGAVLCGFALGWAMLAVLSVRFTDQPQRWAVAPALVMGLGGLLLLVFGSPVHLVLNWIWPLAVLALAIWMAVQVHRQLRGRGARWLLYPVIGIMALASIGGGIETVSEAADAAAYPAPGRSIDVGGHRLHLHCTGSGSPTVVLEAGGGEMSSNLGWIAPAVSRNTRVCVYDRAGRGWSEAASPAPRGAQIATDLHTLLHRAGVPGPYVLAGHSFGGLYVLTFAAHYPGEVAGMVLIDSTAPMAKSPDGAPPTSLVYRLSALLSSSARLGLARLVATLTPGSLPQPFRGEVVANEATASNLRSTIDEYIDAGEAVGQAGTVTSLGDKPLIVLTAGIGSDAAHRAVQNRLATLSTDSVHRVVAGADHEGLVAEKDGAAATSRAILDVVSSLRGGGPMVR